MHLNYLIPSSPLSKGHYLAKKLSVMILTMLLLSVPNYQLEACMGTPAPPCGRSVFVAKFTPGTVVFPAAGPITVPIGVLPFAFWNNQGMPPFCPQPIAATMTLTLTCFPSGVVIGPQAFAVPVPTVPGAQPLGGPLNFIIPAGVFPPGTPPQICLVVGVYSVTFSDGVTLMFTGDTEVCIVPPSSLDPEKPRLDMSYLPLYDGELYQTCRRGDQANLYFLIANNDPNESVTLDLSSIGRQVAHLPDGFDPQTAYGNDVYSISLPEPDTDTYPAAFVDDLMPGELLPEGDPSIPNQQLLSRSITLAPLEVTIIGIAIRSFGMCANGSCNERLAKVEGTFSNGDPALACASTLLVVDEAPPKTVLCEFADQVKSFSPGQAVWSASTFATPEGPIPHAQTFAVGNLPPPNLGFQTVANDFLLPPEGTEYLRMDQLPTSVSYSVHYSSAACNVESGANLVQIQGLNSEETPFISLPVISFQEFGAFLNVFYDASQDFLVLSVEDVILFEGPASQFLEMPPPEFCVDYEICRSYEKRSDPNAKSIHVRPFALAHLLPNPNEDPGCDTLGVFNNLNMPVDWLASVDGTNVSLPSTTGMGSLVTCYSDLATIALAPGTTISYLNVECPDAINNPVRVPIALRLAMVVNTNELPNNRLMITSAPNPFRESTIIRYTLEEAASVQLQVFNHLGQAVRMLQSTTRQAAGEHSLHWDGRTDNGIRATPGIYYIRIRVAGTEQLEKLILM